MKWAANLLCYNEELFILQQLKQLDGVVDEIHIADGTFSSYKENVNEYWAANGLSEDNHHSTDNTLKIIEEFRSKSKSSIFLYDMSGTERDARNFLLGKSNADYVLIIDADEFYFDLKKVLNECEDLFSKGYNKVLAKELYEFYFDFKHYVTSFNVHIAIKRKDIFSTPRATKSSNFGFCNQTMFHYSYVKLFDRLVDKMKPYGKKGHDWIENIAKNFGKVEDEDLYKMNINKGSVHLITENKKFNLYEGEHPNVVCELVNIWQWKTK